MCESTPAIASRLANVWRLECHTYPSRRLASCSDAREGRLGAPYGLGEESGRLRGP